MAHVKADDDAPLHLLYRSLVSLLLHRHICYVRTKPTLPSPSPPLLGTLARLNPARKSISHSLARRLWRIPHQRPSRKIHLLACSSTTQKARTHSRLASPLVRRPTRPFTDHQASEAFPQSLGTTTASSERRWTLRRIRKLPPPPIPSPPRPGPPRQHPTSLPSYVGARHNLVPFSLRLPLRNRPLPSTAELPPPLSSFLRFSPSQPPQLNLKHSLKRLLPWHSTLSRRRRSMDTKRRGSTTGGTRSRGLGRCTFFARLARMTLLHPDWRISRKRPGVRAIRSGGRSFEEYGVRHRAAPEKERKVAWARAWRTSSGNCR